MESVGRDGDPAKSMIQGDGRGYKRNKKTGIPAQPGRDMKR
jgi:hypothetical protein